MPVRLRRRCWYSSQTAGSYFFLIEATFFLCIFEMFDLNFWISSFTICVNVVHSNFCVFPFYYFQLFYVFPALKVIYECEWMCIYIPHISHTVSRRFTILIEWDRTSACKGASGCRYQSIFDLTHPPSPCMKCTMKQQIDHHTGNYAPYSFRQVCGFFNVPCWPCNTEDAGDGAYGL